MPVLPVGVRPALHQERLVVRPGDELLVVPHLKEGELDLDRDRGLQLTHAT